MGNDAVDKLNWSSILKNVIGLLIKKTKYGYECRKNWEDKMNEPIVPFPLDYSHRIHLIEKGELKPAKYELRFMFDWCADSCLWSLDDAAIERYGVGPVDLDELPLSAELKKKLQNLCDEHDTALDWDCPQNGLVWDWERQYAFLERARVVCWDTIHELGIDYGVSFNKDDII